MESIHINEKDLLEKNNLFKKIEQAVSNLNNIISNVNMLDNYNHRTYRLELKISLLWKDFEISKSRNKADATCDSLGLKNIEIKTRNNKNKKLSNLSLFKEKYMFDKQDRPGRRDYILKSDGLVFAIFYYEQLYWIFWTNDKNTLEQYRQICEYKQNKFLPKFEEAQKNKNKNGGYDTITISLFDFDNDTKWNFYYENEIYDGVTLKEIKEFLDIPNK